MTVNIGITGHQELPNSEDWNWVEAQIRHEISQYRDNLVGYSSLAKGTDQLFAKVVLAQGGTLHAIIPFADYESVLKGKALRTYKHLLELSDCEVLDVEGTDEDAYLAAGKRIVDSAKLMIAVWDGQIAKGKGGTADIVEYSRLRRVAIIHIDPERRKVIKTGR